MKIKIGAYKVPAKDHKKLCAIASRIDDKKNDLSKTEERILERAVINCSGDVLRAEQTLRNIVLQNTMASLKDKAKTGYVPEEDLMNLYDLNLSGTEVSDIIYDLERFMSSINLVTDRDRVSDVNLPGLSEARTFVLYCAEYAMIMRVFSSNNDHDITGANYLNILRFARYNKELVMKIVMEELSKNPPLVKRLESKVKTEEISKASP